MWIYVNKIRYRIDERRICYKVYVKFLEIIVVWWLVKSINELWRIIFVVWKRIMCVVLWIIYKEIL